MPPMGFRRWTSAMVRTLTQYVITYYCYHNTIAAVGLQYYKMDFLLFMICVIQVLALTEENCIFNGCASYNNNNDNNMLNINYERITTSKIN